MWTDYLQNFLRLAWQSNREPCLVMVPQIGTSRRKSSNCVVQKLLSSVGAINSSSLMRELHTNIFYIASDSSSIICGHTAMSVCNSPTTHCMICCCFLSPIFSCFSLWQLQNHSMNCIGCSFAPFLASLFNSHQQPLHTLLLWPLLHLSLCSCVMVTKNHYMSCCWFFFPTFPCVSVWWAPTTIIY